MQHLIISCVLIVLVESSLAQTSRSCIIAIQGNNTERMLHNGSTLAVEEDINKPSSDCDFCTCQQFVVEAIDLSCCGNDNNVPWLAPTPQWCTVAYDDDGCSKPLVSSDDHTKRCNTLIDPGHFPILIE